MTDVAPTSAVEVVDRPAPVARDVVNNPPQGWRIRPIPNLANLTIEWECSSVDGDVFKTHVQDDIAGLIQGIEDAKRTQPPAQGQISAGDVQAFGSQFGLR